MRPHGWQERGRNRAYRVLRKGRPAPQFDSKMSQIGGVRGMQAAY